MLNFILKVLRLLRIPQLLTHVKTTRDDNAKPVTDGSSCGIRLRNTMQSFLLKIFLSGISVDVFIILVTENLRNTAVKQIEPYQATLGSGAWSYKEREREREREREIKTLGPHCHAISSIESPSSPQNPHNFLCERQGRRRETELI